MSKGLEGPQRTLGGTAPGSPRAAHPKAATRNRPRASESPHQRAPTARSVHAFLVGLLLILILRARGPGRIGHGTAPHHVPKHAVEQILGRPVDPGEASIKPDESQRLTGTGGSGMYEWTAPGATVTSGMGETFVFIPAALGDFTVMVRDMCTGEVALAYINVKAEEN